MQSAADLSVRRTGRAGDARPRISTILSAPMNPHSVEGLVLTVAFERTPEAQAQRALQIFLRQIEQSVEAAIAATSGRNDRQAIAEKLLEPDFQKYPELAEHRREVAIDRPALRARARSAGDAGRDRPPGRARPRRRPAPARLRPPLQARPTSPPRSCAAWPSTRSSAPRSSSRSSAPTSRRPCSAITSASTAKATPAASPASRSRSPRASSRSPTPGWP